MIGKVIGKAPHKVCKGRPKGARGAREQRSREGGQTARGEIGCGGGGAERRARTHVRVEGAGRAAGKPGTRRSSSSSSSSGYGQQLCHSCTRPGASERLPTGTCLVCTARRRLPVHACGTPHVSCGRQVLYCPAQAGCERLAACLRAQQCRRQRHRGDKQWPLLRARARHTGWRAVGVGRYIPVLRALPRYVAASLAPTRTPVSDSSVPVARRHWNTPVTLTPAVRAANEGHCAYVVYQEAQGAHGLWGMSHVGLMRAQGAD